MPPLSQGDVMVLAEDAAQPAAREEHRAGAAGAADTGLLPEVQGCPGRRHFSALAAEARLSRPAVRMAHARAEGAVAHHPINCLKSRFHGIVSRIKDVPFYSDYQIMLFGF